MLGYLTEIGIVVFMLGMLYAIWQLMKLAFCAICMFLCACCEDKEIDDFFMIDDDDE